MQQEVTNKYEKDLIKKGYAAIAGIDEVGMACIAGPVVAATVIFSDYTAISGLKDSKQTDPEEREDLYYRILKQAASTRVGVVSAQQINELNIYWASRAAMHRALSSLYFVPDYLLVDGNKPLDTELPQQAVVKGDTKIMSIAAASIIAKVTRDRIMCILHESHPQYKWNSNKGYPSSDHRKAVCEYGITSQHRLNFAGVIKKGRWKNYQGLGENMRK